MRVSISAIESNLLRIGQEAIAKVIKHAEAREIQIELGFNRGNVSLRILDDGIRAATRMAPADGWHRRGKTNRAHRHEGLYILSQGPGQDSEGRDRCRSTAKTDRSPRAIEHGNALWLGFAR